MKLSKKFIAALSVATMLVTAMSVIGCKKEDDDDEENAISGSNKKYSINYTNSSDTNIYRCYNTTTFKHEGELVKITFEKQTATSHDGVMGFIWDLGQSKDAESVTQTSGVVKPAITTDGARNFFVIGFNGKGATNGPRYYISKYFNVKNLQAENFGATTKVTNHAEGIAATEPKEIVVKDWTTLSGLDVAADGTLTVWVDIYPVWTGSKYGVPYKSAAYNGEAAYQVDIYNTDPSAGTATKIDSAKINKDVTGYSGEPKQHQLGVYANVQAKKTLKGSWQLVTDYAADEVVEE